MRSCLDALLAYREGEVGSLLHVGRDGEELRSEAALRGFDVHGHEQRPAAAVAARARGGGQGGTVGGPSDARPDPRSFDACVLAHLVEQAANPLALLDEVATLLRPGGTLLVITPSAESSATAGGHAPPIPPAQDQRAFVNPATLENALARAGFRSIVLETGRSDGILALGTLVQRRARPLLSIIVPVYNERDTFKLVMDRLLAKALPSVDREIIVVESNSSDGTREDVLFYRDVAGVHVILQDRARGKGNAVRAGLEHASGDFILIQDADLEYDLDDYERLLDPLIHYRTAWVLGTRHGSAWSMRQFTDSRWLALFMNTGHIFFTFLLNILTGQQLSDPFTMYKVFRRDCIHDLVFEEDRFAFDWELVIKLLRKGYRPIEIPVRYRSRSFRQGKKVHLLRDPARWLWVAFKYRFSPLRRRPRASERSS